MFRRMVVVVMIAGIAGIGMMLALPPVAAAQENPSATRSFSPASVAPGGTVVVTITAANYGSTGAVTETLPTGFKDVSSRLQVDLDPGVARFTLQGEPSFTYTVTAPSVEGSYTFSGTLTDSKGADHDVRGAVTVTVASDPLVTRYDANNNGQIDRSEVITAINDYLFGDEGDTITRAEVIKLINLYLFGPTPAPTAQPPGAPTGLTATAGGQTRIDLSWNAPASNGGAAITGYRIEVSTDRSSWSSLNANTGSSATRYSHTGLTAGSARHYRVSAINSAGTGPASNVATATTDTTAQAPDLVVGPPTVTSNSPDAGASFTLSATVRNGGDGSSGPTTLTYYRSTDSTITLSDTKVGTDSVGGLAASRTSNESIELTAPSSAGTYYYGACVEPVSGEDSTGNNCSDAVAVTVVERPDLVVEQPSVSNGNPDAGASFTLSATVRNRGSSSSTPTRLRYYRSIDSTITSSDTQVGLVSVGGLAAAGTRNESISLNAPSGAGTYYFGACVEPVSGEANTGNNCSDAVQVKVVERPDLVVEQLSVSNSRPDAGALFILNATVRNQGIGSSAPTGLTYFQSTDSTITLSDTKVGDSYVDGIAASGSRPLSIQLTAPLEAGTYHYGACVEPVSGEASTGNNCSDAVQVEVVGRPDLVVEPPSVDDPSPDTGGSFTLSVKVLNRGSSSSVLTTLRYFQSTDSTIRSSDTQVGTTETVDVLAPSGGIAKSIDLTAPMNAGTYYYGACVEPVSGEASTDNNCSDAVRVTVG